MIDTIVSDEPPVIAAPGDYRGGREGPRMITQLKFVSIPTADQPRALGFWTEQVGFTLLTDQPFDDRQRWIELSVGDSATRVVLFVPGEEDRDRIGRAFYGAFAC